MALQRRIDDASASARPADAAERAAALLPLRLITGWQLREPRGEAAGTTADIDLAPGVEPTPDVAMAIDGWLSRSFAATVKPRILALWPYGTRPGG